MTNQASSRDSRDGWHIVFRKDGRWTVGAVRAGLIALLGDASVTDKCYWWSDELILVTHNTKNEVQIHPNHGPKTTDDPFGTTDDPFGEGIPEEAISEAARIAGVIITWS